MAKKTSLRDIANRVGVSTALVSYVMNGKEKEGRVRKETVEKVLQAAKDLNYQPNLIAKSLKSGQSKTIGLIVADISNPFFSSIARQIEDAARKRGYVVIFGSSDESAEKSEHLVNVFLNRQVDGFIIAPAAGTQSQIKAIQRTGKPVILIDRYFPELPTDCVRVNNLEASKQAVEHLITQGRRHIAMLSYKTDLAHMEQRKNGYRKALKQYGLPVDPHLMLEASYQDLEREVDTQLKDLLERKSADVEPVDGIFFATNSLAIAGLKVINQMKIKVPKEISIVSFDQSDVFDFYYAPLSYVAQSIESLALQAVELVIKRLREKSPPREYITTVIEANLVVRGS